MIRRRLRALPAALALVVAGPSFAAAAPAAPLTLGEVLASSAQHQPQILEAIARERQADARLLAAQGAFDLVFDVDAQARALGYYDGTYADLRTTRPLPGNGGQVYGGYRLSLGDFPVYDGKQVTNGLGEFRAGAVFSLLRDRLIDERRGKRDLAGSDIEIAAFEREAVAIGVQRRAIDAYQQWVAAGLRLRLYRELADLARNRQASIERQVQLGARPAILAVENRQNMVRRSALVVRSEQELQLAANALSLFLRDQLGQRVTPTADRLPDAMPEGVRPRLEDTQVHLADRPDLKALTARIGQTETRAALAQNELRPRLDIRAEASKDFGAGSATRRPAEALVGLRFSLPLEQRSARGRIAEVAAERDALSQRQRLLEDQIGVEIANLRAQVRGAGELVRLAGDEAALARRMAEAERRRFDLGASDFLLVNLREESAADAALRTLDAALREASARAELAAVVADRAALGL
ncbi:TolC family protein [Novosphingobium huizhouense]|uniref:TolC family protein n=1 Tax=Novosphingobium huizhouense TaxID=2866625 RepID=UPI001CD82B19|nr:TolC family protein [Novosphingobium huizhouense]